MSRDSNDKVIVLDNTGTYVYVGVAPRWVRMMLWAIAIGAIALVVFG